mmetsp:Transcript_10006/g.14336  ORF Transcript_10006/g.14336 Transcript_10006/m.14336 type:complete len:402 (-) Transcript_10006:31-1236(-)|eukprot:CAMPEP_0201691902 /NCGR_PEP_ID=MMETSP0578-20130828/4931_1 /ASSEMBLY_ACC=CAM_ASM_000663 /TAXON_ID=267565 /ORGANISM="Skeletonema grethea, Strain CCMP 1804" /LENGTH=401 /DNA_ID=CAMNT_0048177183 /DNA_START=122 /DNA_END=1327 /DNA_ORIENTATION=-
MTIRNSLLSVLLLVGVEGFLTHNQRASLSKPLFDSSEGALELDNNEVGSDVVRSPLRFLGPYPSMPLRFPGLATASQKSRNVTGISLDFVLDTAANTNTINAQVASELELEKVGEAPGGVGAGGGLMGGDTFLLGDAELDIQRKADEKEEMDDNFIFMQGLTASALPVAAPAAAGLLCLSFFYCFEGGVEFVWGDQTTPPSITFYGSDTNLNVNGMARVPFESLPVSMLPSVTISINGVEMPALFDTGSPITVLNAKAAEAAGIDAAFELTEPTEEKDSGWNPFSKIKANFQQAQDLATATSRGDVLTIMGSDGTPVRLLKSKEPQTLSLEAQTFDAPASQKDEKQCAKIGQSHCYVGDLPGLAALGGIGDSAPPAAVLGMDFLRLRPRVVFRAQQKEVYL